jgi:hypothetical protein
VFVLKLSSPLVPIVRKERKGCGGREREERKEGRGGRREGRKEGRKEGREEGGRSK